jgi:hypothetical protein
MDVHGCTWIYMDIHGCTWIYMDVHDSSHDKGCKMETYTIQSSSVRLYRLSVREVYPWISASEILLSRTTEDKHKVYLGAMKY